MGCISFQGQSNVPVDMRFWGKVSIKEPDECWEWLAGKSSCGYGAFKYNGVMKSAHRISWILSRGSITDEHVLHTCDNPGCVNPNHLFLGTHIDNMVDMVRRGHTGYKTSRFYDEDILVIRRLRKLGYIQASIGDLYGVSHRTIGRILNDSDYPTRGSRYE